MLSIKNEFCIIECQKAKGNGGNRQTGRTKCDLC